MRFGYVFLDKSITSLKVRKTLRPSGQSKAGNPLETSQLKRLVASASTAHVCRSRLAPMASIGNWKLTFPNGKVTPGDIYRKHVFFKNNFAKTKNGRFFMVFKFKTHRNDGLLIFPLWLSVKTQPSKLSLWHAKSDALFLGPHTVAEAKSRAGREIPGQAETGSFEIAPD